MKAELRRLHSPDVADLEGFVPENPYFFSFLLQMIIGPLGKDGEESFDVIVCTPSWLEQKVARHGVMTGRHHLFVSRYDYGELLTYIRSYCDQCGGSSWPEVAEKLGRLGRWEFEDYRQSVFCYGSLVMPCHRGNLRRVECRSK
jgi:Immunity protein 8